MSGRLRYAAGLLAVVMVTGELGPEIGFAQGAPGGLALTAFAGPGSGSSSVVLGGIELRAPEFGRVQPVVGASYWWRPTVGCDAIVGSPCYRNSFALEAGTAIRLGPAANAWRPFLSARLGGLFYGSFDEGVWDPNVGAGVAWSGKGRVGFRGEARYHALVGGNSAPYSPPTSGVVTI